MLKPFLRQGITVALIALAITLVGIAVFAVVRSGPSVDALALLVAAASTLIAAISSHASLEQARTAQLHNVESVVSSPVGED